MEGVGLARLLERKAFVPEKSVCIVTGWWRIPTVDTPESNLLRQSMRERVDRDPLSHKYTVIFKAKGSSKVTNRDGNPVSLACYDYPDSTAKDRLIQAHNILVEAIKSGDFDLKQEFLDNYLKAFLRGIVSKDGSVPNQRTG